MDDKAFEMLRDDIKEIKRDVKNGFAGINGRVRKLEIWRAGIVAIGGALVVVVGLILKYGN